MRPSVLIAMVAMLTTGLAAWAGPTVPKSLRSEVPPAVQSANAPMAAEVEGLTARIADAKRTLETAKANDKTLKLEIKAAKARVKAEKATLKAAKKSKDKTRATAAKESIRAAKTAVGDAEGASDRSGALIGLLSARVAVLQAEQTLKAAKVEQAYAESIADAHPELDLARYDQAVLKAQVTHEKARADLGAAEAKYAGKGGEITGEAAAASVPMAPSADTTTKPPPPSP